MASTEIVKYETAFGEIEITAEDVKKYLVRGDASKVTDQEIKLFMELCRYQRLNPFVGEAYAIKFGNDFQLVVGYETHKRRAEENPTYAGRKSGIVVLREDQVIQKEGTCLYPKEMLIGGWCIVYREKNGKIEETYKEVGLAEYSKMKDGRPTANWASKPATMIEKVAVSQALRTAFPVDYAGLYTAEEFSQESGSYIDTGCGPEALQEVGEPITQKERQDLFRRAQEAFGDPKSGNVVVAKLIGEEGLTSTVGMTKTIYERVMGRLDEEIEKLQKDEELEPDVSRESDERQN